MSKRLPALPPVRLTADGARCRRLCATADYEAALVHYPADVIHPNHEHDRAHLTFLLCGGFADRCHGHDSTPLGSRYGFRPAGSRHSCQFGRGGALILSVDLASPAHVRLEPANWQPSGAQLANLFRLLFANAAPAEQIVDDLVAATAAPSEPRRGPVSKAPLWLRRVVEEMADDPSAEIAAIAHSAGVHRVHLSRAFQQYFGLSPTQFRLHCKSALALRHMMEDGETPSAAAVAAGFADQSHWTRSSRAAAGIGPARIRHLLAA